MEIDYELDPYYSNLGLFIPFNDDKIPTVELRNEREIYTNLLSDIFSPSFFVVEFSVNPLPILGLYLKDHQTQLYDNAQLSEDLNIIAALTEGFEEPYAISFFLGNVLKFSLPNETQSKAINKGYSGLLFSMGSKHIRANTLFDDQWYEIEWKLKGDRRIGDLYHSFSFRVGTKVHGHADISSSYYFGLRRELFNSKVQAYSFYENIGVDFRIDFSSESKSLIQSELFIEKHWPTDKAKISLGIGVKKVIGKYLNDLNYLNQDLQLILRPGIKF